MRLSRKIASDLSRQIEGRIVDMGEIEYELATRVDNGRVSHEPEVVVVAETAADVARTVGYAAKNGIRMTTRCGGHGASGYALNSEGIVLDVRQLDGKALDRSSGVLTLGMGNIWRSVYDYLETSQTGLIPIGGGCPGVGVAGFLLGAGFSFVSRSYGLGSDNVLSLTVVKPDGTIEKIDRRNDSELFWGLRGCGGGNLAVAVEAELQAQQTSSESMMVGQIFFPFHRIEEVLPVYNDIESKLPDSMAIYGYLGYQLDPRNPVEKVLTLRFTPVYNGRFAHGVELLEPLLALDPVRVELFDMTLPEWEDFIGAGTQVEGRSAYIRSVVAPPGSMNPAVAKVFMKHMTRAPSKDSFVVWTHLGGEVARGGDGEGCFAHREARFVPEVKAIWDSSRPGDMRRNVEWAYDFFEELYDVAGATGAYVNYIDPLLVDWDQKYYGASHDRLLKLKQAVDPHGFFDFQQGLGSSFAPAGRVGGSHLDLSPLSVTL